MMIILPPLDGSKPYRTTTTTTTINVPSQSPQPQPAQERRSERRRNRTTRKRKRSPREERKPLLPLEDRVPAVFLQALAAHVQPDELFIKDPQKTSRGQLFRILRRLQRTKVVVEGHGATLRLFQLAQAAFPGSTTTLCQPKYKQRTMETLMQHMEFLEDRVRGSPRAVLLGDSMLERLTTKKIIRSSSHSLFNFSVGGDGVEHLRLRLEIAHRTYFSETPTFVLLIGINNVMGASRGNESQSNVATPQAIVHAIGDLMRFILDSSQRTTPPSIYLCKLLHVLGSDDLDATIINENVELVNRLLEDLPSTFPEGTIHLIHTIMERKVENYLDDGLHLSPSHGYPALLAQLPSFVQNAVLSTGTNKKLASSGDKFGPAGSDLW